MYWSSKKQHTSGFLPHAIIAGALLWCLSGCIDPDQSVDFETDLISLNQILDSVFLTAGNDSIRTVDKTIRVSGSVPETQRVTDHNVLHDLDKLREYDVATPRWADFVNTSRKDSLGWDLLLYTIANKRAPVQEISIKLKSGMIENVKIRSEKRSVVSTQNVVIDWNVDEGYTFHNESKLLFRKPATFTMDVIYMDHENSE